MAWYRYVRYGSIFGGWACFFAYLQSGTKEYLYLIPLILTAGVLMTPLQNKIEKRDTNGKG